MTVLISGLAIYGAASLETDFDLADFVDEDMDIMEVRDELNAGYESAGWKVIHLLMEPAEDQPPSPEIWICSASRNFHFDLKSNNDIVGTNFESHLPPTKDLIR